MAILTIVKAGAPILKGTAQPVETITKQTKKLLDDMAETMYAAEGVGLAAPQVNVPQQLIVLDGGNGLIELINPKIIETSKETEIGSEGCLSVPGYYGEVERYSKIKVKSLNRRGKIVYFNPEGFLARIFQHEIDHLTGILFIEKANNLRLVEG
ncbi:MAG: peptide deformylase [Megasphaera sp.]|jgi:peptide deformylase|uniref:peptide deformylase n=1 Tax=Megasphaera sueciensis TaxID=349094 RepID=UPI003D0215A6|nr:peptide deformylase [Megasphaera sp.]MCI1823010.1 peptide deformylase [Megasphaera sp.]